MLKKGNNSPLEPMKSPDPQNSTLGPSLIFDGKLKGKEDLIIKGNLQGKIILENNSLFVASGSHVKAEIRSKNVTIKGSVEGNIHASGKVFITKEGKMTGDIAAYRISIMDGAKFKGSIKMLSSIQQTY
ncbi:MAG: bactofilin family protein [Acidobacteriota bacterium]